MINLQKGQKISLTKDNESLNKIAVGLGWDENKGLLGFMSDDIDCDASAILLKEDKYNSVVYYGKTSNSNKSINHSGDNLTGAGDGDDETINVNLQDIPSEINKIVFVVNIYACAARRQHFGMIKNAFIRIYDRTTNKELCKFNLSDSYKNRTALVCGEIYRHGTEWKFNAIGEGTFATSIQEICDTYK